MAGEPRPKGVEAEAEADAAADPYVPEYAVPERLLPHLPRTQRLHKVRWAGGMPRCLGRLAWHGMAASGSIGHQPIPAQSALRHARGTYGACAERGLV